MSPPAPPHATHLSPCHPADCPAAAHQPKDCLCNVTNNASPGDNLVMQPPLPPCEVRLSQSQASWSLPPLSSTGSARTPPSQTSLDNVRFSETATSYAMLTLHWVVAARLSTQGTDALHGRLQRQRTHLSIRKNGAGLRVRVSRQQHRCNLGSYLTPGRCPNRDTLVRGCQNRQVDFKSGPSENGGCWLKLRHARGCVIASFRFSGLVLSLSWKETVEDHVINILGVRLRKHLSMALLPRLCRSFARRE